MIYSSVSSSIESIPFALSLIHPTFYSKNGASFAEVIKWKRDAHFASGITASTRCQAERIGFGRCVLNDEPSVRGKCDADHLWPHALGGPSTLDNRVILCKFHNSIKGYGIIHFNWDHVPNWLGAYLAKIRRLKL